VIDLVIALAPYYSNSIGEYDWSRRLGSCFPIFLGHRTYVLLQAIHAIVPLTVITITTLWTFIFTRNYMRRNLGRQQSVLNAESYKEQREIYESRVKNMIGIFGALLLFTLLSWAPYIVVSLIGVVIGLDRIPNQVYACNFVIFLFSYVSNPIVQMYFRKDLLRCCLRMHSLVRRAKRKIDLREKEDIQGQTNTSGVAVAKTNETALGEDDDSDLKI